MKTTDFNPEFFTKICDSIKKALDEGANPVAAFDADGTLWSGDAGLDFYKYQIDNKLISGLPDNAWDSYLEMIDKDVMKGLLWLAQINKGVPIDTLRGWAKDFVKEKKDLGYFDGITKLVNFLKDQGVKVFVVTASTKWSVEPAAIFHGIEQDNVIGVQTKIIDGIITDEQDGPVTWFDGKPKRLIEVSGGQAPFFAAGNSKGDLALLESATHVPLVIQSATENHFNFETEKQMKELAEKNGWHHYSFL